MSPVKTYDGITDEYRDSKYLSFREHVEQHTLFELLGDVRGKTVLDMACGEGFYTRLLKRAGASEVTGVDISAGMIQLAEEERRQPLGCRYVQADVAAFDPAGPVDLVVAMYLLNHARSSEQLRRFCQVCHNALRAGGQFVGVNVNVRNPPKGERHVEEIRLGAIEFESGGRGRRHPLHDHQRGRTAVRVRELLPPARDLHGRVPESGIPGILVGRCRPAPVPARAMGSGTIS